MKTTGGKHTPRARAAARRRRRKGEAAQAEAGLVFERAWRRAMAKGLYLVAEANGWVCMYSRTSGRHVASYHPGDRVLLMGVRRVRCRCFGEAIDVAAGAARA